MCQKRARSLSLIHPFPLPVTTSDITPVNGVPITRMSNCFPQGIPHRPRQASMISRHPSISLQEPPSIPLTFILPTPLPFAQQSKVPTRNQISLNVRPRRPRPSSRPSSQKNKRPLQTQTSLTSSERLQKVLSHMGVASRRAAEDMILSQRIRVNGRTVTNLGTLINPFSDRVAVDGRPVELPRLTWLVVHKPRGVLSVTKNDKRCVADYAPKGRRPGLVAIAPLEEDASGLVILTNERSFVDELSRPHNPFVKEWIVDCEGAVTFHIVEKLRKGILLPGEDGGMIVPTDVQLIGSGPMEIRPGKKAVLTRFEVRLRDNRRQVIRRLFEAVGENVFRASRKSFGPVLIGSLKRGDCRYLTPKEIKALKRGVPGKAVKTPQRE